MEAGRIVLLLIFILSWLLLLIKCYTDDNIIAALVAICTCVILLFINKLVTPNDEDVIRGNAYYIESTYTYQGDTIKTYNAKWKSDNNIKQIK